MAKTQIGGIIQTSPLALIQVLALPAASGAVAAIMAALGVKAISAQAVVECRDYTRCCSLSLTVPQDRLEEALGIVKTVGMDVGARAVEAVPNVGLIAVHGPHFSERPAVAGTMFSALAEAGLELLMITTSISTVACVVAAEDLPRAVAVLQETFVLP